MFEAQVSIYLPGALITVYLNNAGFLYFVTFLPKSHSTSVVNSTFISLLNFIKNHHDLSFSLVPVISICVAFSRVLEKKILSNLVRFSSPPS